MIAAIVLLNGNLRDETDLYGRWEGMEVKTAKNEADRKAILTWSSFNLR